MSRGSLYARPHAPPPARAAARARHTRGKPAARAAPLQPSHHARTRAPPKIVMCPDHNNLFQALYRVSYNISLPFCLQEADPLQPPRRDA